ncbi:MAG: hypothetical protein LDLANPLL_00395 [Turneriella sp.]|nr:hypothetical protein [Turneriella sp.]
MPMHVFFSILLYLVVTVSVTAAVPTSIGYFAKASDTPLSHEIVLRFPIVLSKALQKANRGALIYPNEFSRRREKIKLKNQVLYKADEYKKLQDILDNGSLITGKIFEYEPKNIVLRKNNDKKIEPSTEMDGIDKRNVLVKLYHYNSATNYITTFWVYSKPETVVVDMVRRIFPLVGDRYLKAPIAAGSKVAVLATLNALELNQFYMELSRQRYRVHTLSGDDFTALAANDVEPLRSIQSRLVSYDAVRTLEEEPPFALSAAVDYSDDLADRNEYEAVREQMTNQFAKNFSSVLKKIQAHTQADYLLLFRPQGKKSFARGFDLHSGSLVWFQDSFPSKSSSNEDVLTAMVSEMQRSTPTLSDEQFVELGSQIDKMTAQREDGSLASVAILDFYDRTNSPLYAWLSGSLSSAVDDSMKKIFEYNRNEEQKSNAAGRKFFKSPADITTARLKEFKNETGADYIIFGFYSLSTSSSNIVIESKVYDLVKLTAIGGSVSQSPVDVRLFNAVDEIAQGVVQDIFNMAQKQSK